MRVETIKQIEIPTHSFLTQILPLNLCDSDRLTETNSTTLHAHHSPPELPSPQISRYGITFNTSCCKVWPSYPRKEKRRPNWASFFRAVFSRLCTDSTCPSVLIYSPKHATFFTEPGCINLVPFGLYFSQSIDLAIL